tara:strand:- start:965 stop:1756 length:792 start_codon:yes stop_codon:yes gene_type:complete
MEERPLQIEFETEFLERFEVIRSELGLDSIRPNLRSERRTALILGGLFLLVSLSASSLLLTLLGIPLTIPFHAIYIATMLIWAFLWLYRHVIGGSVHHFFIKRIFEFSFRLKGPGIDGISAVEVSDDGFFINTKHASSLYRWPCIWDVRRSKDWTALKLIDFKVQIIPSRAFDSDEDYNWFVDEIERRNAEAGGSAQIITEFLKENTLNCPKCKYPLHQTPQALCPECGRDIDWNDFRYSTSELAIIPDDMKHYLESARPEKM